MLGFDYFTLLDHLTIARSRKHIQKYYGTAETGSFPVRLPPINIKPDVDRAGEFRLDSDINPEIRRLNHGCLRTASLRPATSKLTTMPSTAPRFGAAKASSRQVDRRKPDSLCCGVTFWRVWKARPSRSPFSGN